MTAPKIKPAVAPEIQVATVIESNDAPVTVVEDYTEGDANAPAAPVRVEVIDSGAGTVVENYF